MSRQRYWVVLIGATLLPFAIAIGLNIFASRDEMEYWVLWTLIIVLGFICGLIVLAAATIRRLLAIGNPGWKTLLLISAISLLTPLTILMLVIPQPILQKLSPSNVPGVTLLFLAIVPAASLPENCKKFPGLDKTYLAGFCIGVLCSVGLGSTLLILSALS
jgi:uncharacterized membrane protein YhaH (DUF805 family)